MHQCLNSPLVKGSSLALSHIYIEEKSDHFFQTRKHLDEKLCEITYLADRHIISDQCANFAQLLAKKVRERKINYSREELIALSLHQAARSVPKMFLSLDQICYLLGFHLEEKSFGVN